MARTRTSREWIKPEDHYWWRSENATDLYTIHSVLLFDEPLDFDELRAWLDARTEAIGRFRDRLVVPKGRVSYPYWEHHSGFNIDEHLYRLELGKRIERADLEEIVSGFMSGPLDYSKPPWEAYLVEGDGTNGALIFRLHHVMGDGLALVQLLLDMSDDAAQDASSTARPKSFLPGERTARTGLALLKTGARLAVHPRRTVTRTIDVLAEWSWNLAVQPDPHTCLKEEAGIAKRVALTTTLSLAQVEAFGRAHGATVNDVLLALLTGALRRYLDERGQPLEGEEIRALLPFNIRPKDEKPTLDNTFGMVAVSLPLGVTDPAERLEEVRRRMTELKQSAAPSANYLYMSLVGLAPKAVQDALTEIIVRRLSVMVTNVPGPDHPVHVAGKRLSDIVFWAPGAGRPGLTVSIISYAGNLNVALASDIHRVPDPAVLARAFDEEFRAFCESETRHPSARKHSAAAHAKRRARVPDR